MEKGRRKRLRCSSPFRVTATQLLSFLTATSSIAAYATTAAAAAASGLNPQLPLIPQQPAISPDLQRESFHLRSILHHGTFLHPGLLRKLNVPPSAQVWLEDKTVGQLALRDSGLPVSSTALNIQRMVDRSPSAMYNLMSGGRERGAPLDVPASSWTVDEINGPNITDKETVLSLARMASNAYVLDSEGDGWEDVGKGFNYTQDFGWEGDGLRGHIFADTTNRTIVIGLKGTSPAVFDGADTTTNDKINDNLFFSCCCGQGGSVLWHQVCNCQTSTYTCNSTCVIQSLRQEDRYYYAARQLYGNVTAMYPDADVWITGHSLGGAVSSLLGLTYGLPVVSFEAPGDAMAAYRLGLPVPPNYRMASNDDPPPLSGIYHFGHTGDPVFTGNCGSCTIAGYAMESVCHTGMVCRYDTVKDKGFHSYIGHHKIGSVIHDVIEVYEEPAKCKAVKDCYDCFNWKFFNSNGSETTTTTMSSSPTSTSYSRTRTETCQTPGWFGCLDETTTTTTTSTSSSESSTTLTTTSSTSTCKTPGWFGCLDPTTSTTTMTLTSTVPTSTCLTPGWFWCKDKTTTSTVVTTTTTSTSTCTTMGFFGCKDETTQAALVAPSTMKLTPGYRVSGTTPTATAMSRATRHWFWPKQYDSSMKDIHEDSL